MKSPDTIVAIYPSARELIWDVWEHRFLTADQVSRLHNTPRESARLALDRVADAGYLARIPRATVTPDEPKIVYALDQRGADEIAIRLGNDRRTVHWRRYHNQVGRQYMEHRLAVNDVRVVLTVGVRGLGGDMREWIYEPPIKEWSVYDPDELAPPLRLRPDAYTVLTADSTSGPAIHAFVEVDMGTESHARFTSKIRRYLAYKESRLFRIRFTGRAFRVLAIATSLARLRALKKATEDQGGQRMFWFALLDHLISGSPGAPPWQIAGLSSIDGPVGFDLFPESNMRRR
jgi:hypothetical protein